MQRSNFIRLLVFTLLVIIVSVLLIPSKNGKIAEKVQINRPIPSFSPNNLTNLPLNLPAGIEISYYAQNLGSPRVMIEDQQGNILTSITSEGKILLLPDANQDGEADKNIVLIKSLKKPHGLALSCQGQKCQLFIAEENQVTLWDYNPQTLQGRRVKKILTLDSGQGHFTRTIKIINIDGQDKLFISVGSSCNVCREKTEQRAKILVSDLDGSNLKIYAQGLRNAVFLQRIQ